ncbi:TWiK family of potassium channels protein 7-like [Ruditapes philippinarum]|uniref:TWiK family of potassium channels protein 7-like n=1 Tax=Ruditapes philippinarum TaxID=129788 RepID=UPI00295AF868|nr:TWiK family of potassium channels protein 7-like [Ruditapes philippinarum]
MGSEEIQKDKDSNQSGFKSIAKLIFSHSGQILIVLVYCVMGGFMFEYLEKENEVQTCVDSRKEYRDMENETLLSLIDVVLSNPLGSEASDAQIIGVFETFRNNTLIIGYDGSWCEGYGLPEGPMHEWTFAGGLFFSMTILTTIGYGHIAPKTIWGRILCMSYAMMGIPIMLIMLANIGDVLADIFRYVYAKIICCGCLKRKKKKKPPQQEKSSSNNTGPPWRPPNAMVREPLTIGDTETKQRYHGANPLNIKALGTADLKERGRLVRMGSSKEPLIVDDDSDDDDDEQEWDEISKVAVPLTISLGIIGLYIVFGAILFKYWEGWDMLQSSYFCFITLSTIGFGDVTPGRDFTDPAANARLIIGTIYSIFGMAILSMCFTLMQEEMTAKFLWIGKKMGVVEDEEDEEVEAEKVLSSHTSHSDC